MTTEAGDSGYYTLGTHLVDVSNVETADVVVTQRGWLRTVRTVLANAITVANAILTVSKNGTALSPTITVTQSGSAARDVDSADYNEPVEAGDVLRIASDGGSTTTSKLGVFFDIKRTP